MPEDYIPLPDGKWVKKGRLETQKGEWKLPTSRDSHNFNLVEDKPQDAEKGLAQAIRDFIGKIQGAFSTSQLDNELGIVGKGKENRRVTLWRLCDEGLIERVKPGVYRVKEPALPDMQWQIADNTNGLDIKLPFEIHNWVEIYPKNILVIAGTTNAGKTAYLLNFIKDNM